MKFFKSNNIVLVPLITACIVFLFLQLFWVNENRSRLLSPSMLSIFKGIMKEQTITINCSHCLGSGVVERDGKDEVCPHCFGLGHKMIRIMKDNEFICDACNGIGRTTDSLGKTHTCIVCDGRGVVIRKPERTNTLERIERHIPCDHCDGIGTVKNADGWRVICPICFGIGYKEQAIYDVDHASCPACGGMGRIPDADHPDRGITCPRCDGQGLID